MACLHYYRKREKKRGGRAGFGLASHQSITNGEPVMVSLDWTVKRGDLCGDRCRDSREFILARSEGRLSEKRAIVFLIYVPL